MDKEKKIKEFLYAYNKMYNFRFRDHSEQGFLSLMNQIDDFRKINHEILDNLPVLNDEIQRAKEMLNAADTHKKKVEVLEDMFHSQFIFPTMFMLSIPQYPDVEIQGRVIRGGISCAEYILHSLTVIPETLGTFLLGSKSNQYAEKEGWRYIFPNADEREIEIMSSILRDKPSHFLFAGKEVEFDSEMKAPICFLWAEKDSPNYNKIKINISSLAKGFMASIVNYLDELRNAKEGDRIRNNFNNAIKKWWSAPNAGHITDLNKPFWDRDFELPILVFGDGCAKSFALKLKCAFADKFLDLRNERRVWSKEIVRREVAKNPSVVILTGMTRDGKFRGTPELDKIARTILKVTCRRNEIFIEDIKRNVRAMTHPKLK